MRAYGAFIGSLRGRWGGSEGELLEFARECAATRRFNTEVPFQAFEAVEQLERDQWDEIRGDRDDPLLPYERPPSPYATANVYTMVEAVLERYRREPARELEWRRFASLQAAIAYKAGKYERARELLHELGGTLAGAGSWAMHEDTAEGDEAYAAPDGAGPAARSASGWRSEGAGSAAVLRAGPCESAARSAGAARQAARGDGAGGRRRSRAQCSPAARQGAARVERAPGGSWLVEPDGALLGTSGEPRNDDRRRCAGRPILRAGGRRRDALSTSNGQFQGGILFGRRPTYDSYKWASFRLKKTAHEGEVVYFSQHFAKPNQRVPRKVAAEEPRRDSVPWDGTALGVRRRRTGGRGLPAGVGPAARRRRPGRLRRIYRRQRLQSPVSGARLRRLTAAPTLPLGRR